MRPVRLFLAGIAPLALTAHASKIAWVTTDFSTGGLASHTAGECAAAQIPVLVPGDAVVRGGQGYVFVVGRLGYDNVTVLDAARLENVVHQYSTGNGTNPQDILAVGPDRAFITLFERSWLLVAHALSGEILDSVDLAPFADADGIPEATRLVRHGDRVYIVCQRLDRATPMMDPAGPGCIAVVDALTGQLVDMDPATPEVDPLWLPGSNPTSACQVGCDLFLTCTGNWSSYEDGALVHVDLGSGQARIIMEEQTAGANVSAVAVHGQKAFLVASYPDWSNAVITCDLASGIPGEPLPGPSGGYIPDILIHDGILYIADQGTWSNPALAGVMLIDAVAEGIICGPVFTGLPPMSGAVIAPAGALGPSMETLVRVWPNPASGLVTVGLPHECEDCLLALHDVSGRVVTRSAVAGQLTTIDLRGVPGGVAPGVYLLCIDGSALRWTGRVVLR